MTTREIARQAGNVQRNARILLEQIGEYPGTIAAELLPDEREAVLSALERVDTHLADARSKGGLLTVADAVQRVVEGSPTMRRLLLDSGYDPGAEQEKRLGVMRAFTFEDDDAALASDDDIQKSLVAIRNVVGDFREEIVAKQQERPAQPGTGATPDRQSDV